MFRTRTGRTLLLRLFVHGVQAHCAVTDFAEGVGADVVKDLAGLSDRVLPCVSTGFRTNWDRAPLSGFRTTPG